MTATKQIVRLASLALVAVAFVVVPRSSQGAQVSPFALSECPSGTFCLWSGTNFSGSVQKITTTNAYRSITLSSTQSYYNNRTRRTWLHDQSDGSGSTVCINPGASKATTSGWQTTAEAAYLATITTC